MNAQDSGNQRWRGACHEAGHVVIAVLNGMGFYPVQPVGDDGSGKVVAVDNPLGSLQDGWTDTRMWTDEGILVWRKFYAAGAAAEEVMFGKAETNYTEDQTSHDSIEKHWPQTISPGWNGALELAELELDRESIEKIAKKLTGKTPLSDEQAYILLGVRSPFG